MIELDIEVDTKRVSLFLQGAKASAIPKAEVRALNKVIVTVRKEAVSAIHNVRRLKKGTIRKQLVLQRAFRGSHVAKVKASRRPIALKHFAAKVQGRKGNRRVVVNVTGQRKILEHAFIIESKGGHVFERKGAAALPIQRLSGPSLGSAIVKPSINTAMRQVVATRWPVVFAREVEFALSKVKRR